MKIIIDRFEGDFAVVETSDGSTYNLPKALFKSCTEGDVFILKKNTGETRKQEKEIKSLMSDLFK